MREPLHLRGGARPPTSARDRVSGLLLVVWIALLGADRLDVLGGGAGFVLTPFLLLTPVLLGWEGFRVLALRERLRVPPTLRGYLLLLAGLLAVVVLSTFFARDLFTSAKRTAHLLALVTGTLLVATVAVGRPANPASWARGAILGLALGVGMGAAEIWAFLAGVKEPLTLGPATLDLSVQMYLGYIPRLSGQVADPNRGGLVFLFYLFLVLRFGRSSATRWVGGSAAALLLVLTLSRSILLASAATALTAWLLARRPRVSPRGVLVASAVLALMAALLLTSPVERDDLASRLEPVAERLSPREGSTREHVHLLDRGMREATRSVKRAAIGLGYGNSFLYLQDVFPGSKYGNYHSLYVTFFAEAGVAALLLSLLLLGGPLLRPGPWTPLVGGVVLFNLFYQSAAEPAFWLILAMAWLTSPAFPGRAPLQERA